MASGKIKQLESSVQMRLYTLTKRQFVMVFAGFFICFGVTLIIGIAGPRIISEHHITASELNVGNYSVGPFKIDSGMLSIFNQQLWLLCKIQLQGFKQKDYVMKKNFLMTVKSSGRNMDSSSKAITHVYRKRSRMLRCTIAGCDHIVIMHVGSLDYPSYLITVKFIDLKLQYPIRNVVFTFKYYNAEFTQIEIWFRFVFLVLSFTVTCMFAHSLRQFPLREWTIEQKWMSILLPLLLLYNDPLFPLNFLIHSWIPMTFDAVFQALFLAALLLFWLCAFHGIRQSERNFITFYLPKMIIVGLMGISGCVMLAWQQYNELQDPSYQYKLDIGHFLGLKIFFFIVGTIYLIYLLILLFKAFRDLRNMPFFDVRVQFLGGLMVSVVLISLIVVGVRFGTALLQNNFIAEITTTYQNSTEFLCFYGLFNFYLYTMSFVYSPSKSAIKDALSKDSTSFTMLYDSEEEVIYGKADMPQKRKPFESQQEDEFHLENKDT